MLKLVSVDRMREYEWSRDWLWAVCFPEGPKGFDDWFPATDIDEGQAALDTYQIQGGLSTYEVPQGTTALSINLTAVDTIALDLHDWIDEWVNEGILNRSQGYCGVTPLAECVKRMSIIRFGLGSQKGGGGEPPLVYQVTYWVIPKGAISIKGSSGNSAPITNSFEFVICGRETSSTGYTRTVGSRRSLANALSQSASFKGLALATQLIDTNFG